jgi:hypothetical protein
VYPSMTYWIRLQTRWSVIRYQQRYRTSHQMPASEPCSTPKQLHGGVTHRSCAKSGYACSAPSSLVDADLLPLRITCLSSNQYAARSVDASTRSFRRKARNLRRATCQAQTPSCEGRHLTGRRKANTRPEVLLAQTVDALAVRFRLHHGLADTPDWCRRTDIWLSSSRVLGAICVRLACQVAG